jgi:hypothetical protein
MASALHRVVGNFRDAILKMAGVRLSDTAGSTGTGAEILAGAGVPSGAYGRTSLALLYMRTDPASASTVLYVSEDAGTTWTALAVP